MLQMRLLLIVFLGLSGIAKADWQVSNESSKISFVSTKAINVAEVHTFDEISGELKTNGEFRLTISLDRVNTAIEIRDERMREMLFETADYSSATVSARVEPALFAGLRPGESNSLDIEAMLDLHGVEAPLLISVIVTKLTENDLQVISNQPVVLNSSVFGLGEGIEALREIAGLPSISLAVPVSFVLKLQRNH